MRFAFINLASLIDCRIEDIHSGIIKVKTAKLIETANWVQDISTMIWAFDFKNGGMEREILKKSMQDKAASNLISIPLKQQIGGIEKFNAAVNYASACLICKSSFANLFLFNSAQSIFAPNRIDGRNNA